MKVDQGDGKVEEVVEQEKTPQEIAAAEAEADAAFASGVEKTRHRDAVEEPKAAASNTDTSTEDAKAKAEVAAKATAEAEAKRVAEEKAKAESAAAAAADPWRDVPAGVRAQFTRLEETFNTQLSKLSGHIGGFKSALDRITATAKAASDKVDAPAPTKLEIQEAMSDPEKWKQLQEDFPEWMSPVASEFARLRKDMAAVAKSVQDVKPAAAPAAPAAAPVVDTDSIVSAAEERAYVRLKHPDWKAICATPEFSAWMQKEAPEDIRKKGASEAAEDAIAIFDAYKSHRQKLADAAAAKAKNEKRLAGAVTVTGSAEPPNAGISDDEAFNLGVKQTVRKSAS